MKQGAKTRMRKIAAYFHLSKLHKRSMCFTGITDLIPLATFCRFGPYFQRFVTNLVPRLNNETLKVGTKLATNIKVEIRSLIHGKP